ncbi:MAG: hypothetical protein ACYDCQ_15260 [Dehalococcoidia bacterium]
MYQCTICRWDIELDDVQIRAIHGGCVCIRCYARTVDNEKRMSKELRKELISYLAEVA